MNLLATARRQSTQSAAPNQEPNVIMISDLSADEHWIRFIQENRVDSRCGSYSSPGGRNVELVPRRTSDQSDDIGNGRRASDKEEGSDCDCADSGHYGEAEAYLVQDEFPLEGSGSISVSASGDRRTREQPENPERNVVHVHSVQDKVAPEERRETRGVCTSLEPVDGKQLEGEEGGEVRAEEAVAREDEEAEGEHARGDDPQDQEKCGERL